MRLIVAGLLTIACGAAHADCSIPEGDKKLDPVEAGFCRSDAVFVGRVDSRMETIRSFREDGSDRTRHFWTEKTSLTVLKSFKGATDEKVAMSAELYDKQGAFSLKRESEYLVFATRLNDQEFTAATPACSVQPTLLLADADKVLAQLDAHRSGRKPIDCKRIRPKN